MRSLIPLCVACVIAVLIPFLPSSAEETPRDAGFPGWPEHLEGIPLQPLALDEMTASFARHFPGRIACFEWAGKHVIMRWVQQPTRKLHPASDCFRGAGFTTAHAAPGVDAKGREWGRFIASGTDAPAVRVSECMWDEAGRSWGDVSAWYWNAACKRSVGPWWALTIVEPYSEGVH